MPNRRSLFLFLVLLAAFLMIPCSVSAQEEDPYEDGTETEEIDEDLDSDDDTLKSWPFSEDIDEGRDSYISSLDPDGVVWHDDENGIVTFVSGNEFGTMVQNADDAYALAQEFIGSSDYDFLELRKDYFGDIIVYSYQQIYDNQLLSGCYLKIIANTEGEVLGFVSSLTDDPDDVRWDSFEMPAPANWEERFADWESDTYEKTVTSYSDVVMDISIPVMVDPATGDRYLGDKDRLVFCADISEITELETREDATPINIDQNLFSDGELLSYYLFIQVYDYYAETGWWGPDGERSPVMIQFDTSDENRNNASYASFQDGFHIFNFSVDDGASQSLMVIAHEFTHGVSSTNHVGSYENDTGALDEALSDLIGNAIEADIRQWEPSENAWLTSFRSAHENERAVYVWDQFYTPPTSYPDNDNDYGEVHHNSEVLSIIAWRMYEAGMTPREVFEYWFTFDLTLTPKTDFSETAAKAGWVAEIAGLSEYAPVIKQAAEDLRLNDESVPEQLRDHQGLIVFFNPLDSDNVNAVCYDPWARFEFKTWPIRGTDTIAAVFGEGTFCMVSVKDVEGDNIAFWNPMENSWEMVSSERLTEIYESFDSDYGIQIHPGDVFQLGD